MPFVRAAQECGAIDGMLPVSDLRIRILGLCSRHTRTHTLIREGCWQKYAARVEAMSFSGRSSGVDTQIYLWT
jgi:hypothetical protein